MVHTFRQSLLEGIWQVTEIVAQRMKTDNLREKFKLSQCEVGVDVSLSVLET